MALILFVGSIGEIQAADSPYGHAPGTTPFGFSKDFYKDNGIKENKLVGVKTGSDGLSVLDTSPDPSRNNVRILATNGGYDASGSVLFYPDPPAAFNEDAFRENPLGQQARIIADQFRAFIFPKATGGAFSPAPTNRRQDNVFDTSLGYLTHNPLGLWRLTFVAYTTYALTDSAAQAMMNIYASRNGLDADGTPILKRKHEIVEAEAAGLVQLYTRATNGSNGPPWVV